MLKNIVFDLGNVLVKFDSNELIYHFFKARQEEVKSFYFDSLWDEYDQGLYSVEEMIEKGVKQFPELKSDIKELMYHWTEFVFPLEKNIEYINELKKYNLFASECLFLDDRKDNVVTASNLGFETIEVKDSSKVVDLLKEKISEV